MKKHRKVFIFLLIIILGLCYFLGCVYGFPWEIIRAKIGVAEYVKENYQLTPIKIKRISFLI